MALKNPPVCDFGRALPPFELAEPDGTRHAMADHLGGKGLLVAFICNHCPYVRGIADRLAADTKALMDDGIGVLAVMSNDWRAYPDDAPERMDAFKRASGFRFPYLVDADQSVAREWGAACTPDFFGLNARGELQYRGRLDDWGIHSKADASDGERRTELLDAMRMIAATGEGPREQVPSMGCSIKWR